MSDPSLQASSLAPFHPGPTSPVRRLLEAACLPPAPCASAVVVELDEHGEHSLARVNHGSLSREEADAARRAVQARGPVVIDDEHGAAIVAAAAGPRAAVVCRLAVALTASRLERVLCLADAVHLALDGERLEREHRRLVVERVAGEERVNRAAAYDLHDGPAQQLLFARNMLKQLAGDTSREAGDAAALDDLRAIVDSALEDVRAVMSGLDASARAEESLAELVAAEAELLRRRMAVEVELQLDGELGGLDPTVAVTAYRLVQEAFTNAVRHGGARRLRVALRHRVDRLEISVEDDGRGFDPTSAPPADPDRPVRLGLRGMRERVAVLAGRLDVSSRRGGPTLIHAVLPVTGARRPAPLRRLH